MKVYSAPAIFLFCKILMVTFEEETCALPCTQDKSCFALFISPRLVMLASVFAEAFIGSLEVSGTNVGADIDSFAATTVDAVCMLEP